MFYHISHGDDLDGIGCHVAWAQVHQNFYDSEYIIPANYKDVDEKILVVLEQMTEFDGLLITDIAPQSKEVIDRIDAWYTTNPDNANRLNNHPVVIDHHKTALETLGDYAWVSIDTEYCATHLLVRHMLRNDMLTHPIHIKDLVHFSALVNDYDLWLHRNPLSRELNYLRTAYGHHAFYGRFSSFPAFSAVDKYAGEDKLIRCMMRQEAEYIDNALKKLDFFTVDKTSVGFVFAERYASELGNKILTGHQEVDFAAIINLQARTISLRSRPGGVDVSIVAAKGGGGGHVQAAGFPISDASFKQILDAFF